jgi:NAD(P)-dependent dehydrogenase (short-subunit alcohol dehydrogenase family)
MTNLESKLILVTGASSGIGRDTAMLLSRLGARLCLIARNEERLRQTEGQLQGGGHASYPFDLEDADGLPALMKTMVQTHGPFHGVVHSAGILQLMPISGVNAKRFEKTMRVNVLAGIMMVRGLAQKDCHTTGKASAVLLSSTAALIGSPGQAMYCASKGALMSFAKEAAVELAPLGIRINCVAPAAVRSEMLDQLQKSVPEHHFKQMEKDHPLGFGTTLDVANAVAFLLGDTGAWITGTTLVVDGGVTAH